MAWSIAWSNTKSNLEKAIPGLITAPIQPPPLINWRKFGIGSDGFPGFRPEYAGQTAQGSYAAYLDLEMNVIEEVLVGVAARYEDHENFGDTSNGKLAARWQWTDSLALRGSLSTGFRVPDSGTSKPRRRDIRV